MVHIANACYEREDFLAEGREEGKAEEKIEIAKNMLAEHMDLNIISKMTGLAEEQIVSLKRAIEEEPSTSSGNKRKRTHG